MRLAVTGRNGQVVRSLVERAALAGDVTVVPIGLPEMDLTDPQSVARAIAAVEADVVVSAAAYTAVDKAEDEPEIARAVNVDGAEAVALAAAARGCPLIHLSTDYVFSGDSARPYTENDPTEPQGVYGATKRDGELAVAAALPSHVILRTAWVYSPFGKNFVKTMLRLAGERDEIAVVADQWGNPTSALDIADGVLHVTRCLVERPDEAPYGLFHLAGAGETNWSGLAEEVMAVSRAEGGPFAAIRPILTADYPTRARRPTNSRLDSGKFHRDYGWLGPGWRKSVSQVVRRLVGIQSA